MVKRLGIKKYLQSINDIVLPEPGSQVTKDFVDYVVGAHSWYKIPIHTGVDIIGFNFFIGPGHLIEAKGCINEKVYEEFQNLKYAVLGTHFSCSHEIPREIYDAGLAIVPRDYKSDDSKKIMLHTIGNMIQSIETYRSRFPSLNKK